MSDLEHKTIKAAATATEQGQFSAIAAAYSVDRLSERIVPGAFKATIEAWKGSEKMIPLHWDHEGDPASIIGFVDPATMQETADGLYVEGQLALEDSEVAREAWRSMKANAVSLSFGYLAKTKKDGKVTLITEIDLFEVSIVSAPANVDTRLLSLKGLKEPATIENVQAYVKERFPDFELTQVEEKKVEDPLRKRTFSLALEASGGDPTARPAEPVPDPQPEPLDEVALRRKSDELALEVALG